MKRFVTIPEVYSKMKLPNKKAIMKTKTLSFFALLLLVAQGAWADDKTAYGVLNGEFSVSATKKVHFSRGNLRAYSETNSTWTWYFHENQYDYVGNATGNTAITGNGTSSDIHQYVDLFGWSTESTIYGIHNTNDNSAYSGSFRDWGTNAIANGGNKANCWYTLSKDEWMYIMDSRTTTTTNMPAGIDSNNARYVVAKVNSKNGLIIFPDNYAHPADASVSTNGVICYNDTNNRPYDSYLVSNSSWEKMEAAGAVFLSAAGSRYSTFEGVGSRAVYWTSTPYSENVIGAHPFHFTNGLMNTTWGPRYGGHSVRLTIVSHTIIYDANGGEGTIDPMPKYNGFDRVLPTSGFTRTGYTFAGWNTKEDGTGTSYPAGANYTTDEDVTLYAQWNENYVSGGTTITDDGVTKNATIDESIQIAGVVPNEVTNATLTYTRTIASGANAYTVCLPYAPPTENLTYYTLESVSGSVLNFKEIVGSPAANTPYLVIASSDASVGTTSTAVDFGAAVANPDAVNGYQLKGTLRGIAHGDAEGKYVLQAANKWGLVDNEHPTVYIPPFRAYIEAVSSAHVLDSTFDEDDVTSIDSIRAIDKNGNEQWFDLSGRCINNGQDSKSKGLYIVNGKKLIK